jgi:WD40 repeat protein
LERARVDPLKAGDPDQVGGYRLLGRLGLGGMGQVFLGASPGGRKVAVKVIRPEYAEDVEFRQRFAREIEAARQVGGFHSALVVDAGPDADPPWMVTAYIPGPSLADAVAKDGPLSAAAVRELGAALAEGLTAIHACGLVHRDLKPGNIILAADGPRIIDFGVARLSASTLTTVNTVIGTYGYMAPEQLSRREVTSRSDVFALGGLLVFAATGHGPFEADDLPAVIGHILIEPPDLSPLTGPLRDIVGACLDKDPDRRPALNDLIAYFNTQDPAPGRSEADSAETAPLPSDDAVAGDDAEPGGDSVVGADVMLGTVAVIGTRVGRSPGGDRSATMVRLSAASTVTPGSPMALAPAAPPLGSHTGPITLVTFSPDGTLLATAEEGGRIRLWDTGSWEQAKPTLSVELPHSIHEGRFGQLVFTSDSRVLMAKAPGVSAVLAWDVLSGRPIISPVRTHARIISPDGRFVASRGKGAPKFWAWDSVASRHVATPLRAKTDERIGFFVLFSPDARLVGATDARDGGVHLWDTATGERCGLLRRQHAFDLLSSPYYSIREAAISPDGGLIAIHGETTSVSHYGSRHLLHLWDIADLRRPQQHLIAKTSDTARGRWGIAFSADGRQLASTIDGRLHVWDTASLVPADLGDAGDGAMLMFSPASRLLAEVGRRQLRVWDPAGRMVIAVGPQITGTRDAIRDAAFSPDGALIATAEGGTARVRQVPQT